MTATVVSLSGAPIQSDRRAEFCEHVAAAFDNYLAAAGAEPDALVVVMCGLKQDARVTYLIQGESRGGGTSLLALAHAVILKEIITPTED